MKAIVSRRYGSADVLKLEDIEKPALADNDVLIKLRASAVNLLDWHYMFDRNFPWQLFAIPPKLFRSKLSLIPFLDR